MSIEESTVRKLIEAIEPGLVKGLGMTKTITIQVRNVYGEEKIYPACPDAVLFARLAGTKTLTGQALGIIRSLGYEIAVESPVLRFAG